MRRLVAALVAALLLGAGPAQAAETDITRKEAKHVTKILLGSFVGPAVSSTGEVGTVKAWNCSVEGEHGYCNGSVQAGSVLCKGRFHVRKKDASNYAAWPEKMTCTTNKTGVDA